MNKKRVLSFLVLVMVVALMAAVLWIPNQAVAAAVFATPGVILYTVVGIDKLRQRKTKKEEVSA